MVHEVKAHLFTICPVTGPSASVAKAITTFMSGEETAVTFSHRNDDYVAAELRWHESRHVLTGTIYKLRSNNLPVVVLGKVIRDLPLEEDEVIGEPMCFAFMPEPGGALIHYAHTGARHPSIAGLIDRMGYADALSIEPVIRQDMLDMLDSKQYFRGFEFALSDPKQVAALRAEAGPVKDAIAMTNDLGAVNIRVEITMGHTHGEGMLADKVKALARRLNQFATVAVDEHSPITTIKVRGSDGLDAPLEELDLLRARDSIVIPVAENGRRMDCGDCQRRLLAELVQLRPRFTHQGS